MGNTIKIQSKKKKNKKKGIVLYNVGPVMAFIVCVAAVFQLVHMCTRD